jgi:uncharacterized protein
MRHDIEHLKKIQDLDSEIYSSRELIEEIPAELSKLDQAAELERKALIHLEEELKAIQLQQKQKEADLQDKEANIRKYDAQLSQVKTNKEYASLQSEIRSLKADNSLLEESIIEFFDRVDECQTKLKAEKLRLQEVEQETKKKKAVFEQKTAEAKQKIEDLTKQKAELAKEVDPEVAVLYEKIVQNKHGLALAKAEGEACSACHMRLRPQQMNEIKMESKVILCEQCSRILYMD